MGPKAGLHPESLNQPINVKCRLFITVLYPLPPLNAGHFNTKFFFSLNLRREWAWGKGSLKK